MLQTSGDVLNRRARPEQWDALLDVAAWEVGADFRSEDCGTELRDRVAGLGNDTLTEHEYFAQGQITCKMAIELQKPTTRAQVVEASARALAAAPYRRPDSTSLPIVGIRNKPLVPVFRQLAEVAADATAPPERLVADALSYEVRRRRWQQIRRVIAFRPDLRGARFTMAELDMRHGAAAVSLGEAAMAASTILYSDALAVSLARMGGAVVSSLSDAVRWYGPMPTGLFSDDELRSVDLRQLARSLATLRFDEFNPLHKRSELVGVDAAGKLSFRRQALAAEPLEAHDHPTLLHRRRLGCPALQVTGMIDTGLALMPDMIVAANSRIRKFG